MQGERARAEAEAQHPEARATNREAAGELDGVGDVLDERVAGRRVDPAEQRDGRRTSARLEAARTRNGGTSAPGIGMKR